MNKLIYLLFCLIAGIGLVSAQTTRVTGKVTSAEDGEPIIGASVLVKGTSTGVVTDVDGSFTLNVPANAKTLLISYVGMAAQEVAVKPNLAIRLASDMQNLDEVIVVGYGTQRKKDVTSSISRVGGDDIANMATPSFDQQLAGRAAGVQVTTSSGILGVAPKFRIRGTSTISSGSNPLIVIDGTPVNSGQIDLNASYNPMGDINPNDIQSIEILKDGAATAVYGSRAANGVVLVTTKKGSKGQAKVTYDGYIASSKAAKLHDLLKAKDFVEVTNELFTNWGETSEDAVYDPNGPDTNWNDYVYRNGFQHSHTIGVSGGNDRGNYYTSLGYSNQEGVIRANNLERFNVSANVTQMANKWLQVGVSVNASQSTIIGIQNSENSLGSVGFALPRMLPNVAVFNPDDVTGYNIDAVERKTLGRGINKRIIDNGIANIVWTLDNNLRRNNVTRLLGSAFGQIKLMEGLTLRTQGGIDYTEIRDFLAWMPESGDGLGRGGYMDEASSRYKNWNWQNTLNFDRTFNDVHNFNLTLLQEYTYEDYENAGGSVQNMSDKFFMEHFVTGTYGVQEVYGSKKSKGLASYMLRANYNYDSKYYIGASVRRDGLSVLPKNTRWGSFYGGSLAYRISRESFWTSSSFNDWFNDLRIRASMATVGNSDLGTNWYPYLGTYGGKRYGGETGIAWTNMGNDRLKWETSNSFDVGLDGTLFGGRLGFEMAYFNKTTKDLVMEVPTAPALGIPYNRYYDNIGALKNSGFEFTLNATPVAANGFTWQANLNFATVNNTVTTLVNGQDIIDVFVITREGESYRSIYGFDYYGVNKANGNPVWRKADGSLVQFDTFGSYDYAVYDPAKPSDVSKASSLSAADDRKILGSSLPTWYGGFNNTFTYKDFDLNIFFRFSGGNKVMNASRQRTLLNLEFSNKGTEILGRWQSPEKPGDGMTPRIGYKDDDRLFNASVADSHFVEDGSFFKLSNLALGYTLPKQLTGKLDISRIRLYLQGQNLMTLTKYKGIDPETSSRQGVDWDGMPQQQVFSFGANVTF